MSRILKWTVPVDDRPHPIGTGPVTLVACQHDPTSVQVWTVEHSAEMDTRLAQVYGTGQQVPPGSTPLGSTVADQYGELVWHVVDVTGCTTTHGGDRG